MSSRLSYISRASFAQQQCSSDSYSGSSGLEQSWPYLLLPQTCVHKHATRGLFRVTSRQSSQAENLDNIQRAPALQCFACNEVAQRKGSAQGTRMDLLEFGRSVRLQCSKMTGSQRHKLHPEECLWPGRRQAFGLPPPDSRAQNVHKMTLRRGHHLQSRGWRGPLKPSRFSTRVLVYILCPSGAGVAEVVAAPDLRLKGRNLIVTQSHRRTRTCAAEGACLGWDQPACQLATPASVRGRARASQTSASQF